MGGLTLALIPVYVHLLVPQQWGLVAACITFQGVLALLDAGLAQIMPRDMAIAGGNAVREGKVFRTFSRLYLIVAGIGMLVAQLGAGWLAQHWLRVADIPHDYVEIVLRVAAAQFLFQFANNAHLGYWNGLQRQATANFSQCAFFTAKHLIALSLILLWKAEALAYLLSFMVISSLEWYTNRYFITAQISRSEEAQLITLNDLLGAARQAAGLAAGVLLGVFVSQLDRIILSRTVELEQFGRYIVVAQLGQAFLQLQYPIMRAFLPSLVVAEAGTNSERVSNRTLGLAVLGVGILPALLLATFAEPVLVLWTRDVSIAAEGALPLALIAIAVAFNSIFNIIFIHMVKSSAFHFLAVGYFVAGVIIILIVPECARTYGIVAGGLSWLVFCSVQLFFGVWWWLRQRRNLGRLI